MEMTVDYQNYQITAPVTTAVLNMVSLLEEINTVSCILYDMTYNIIIC